MTTKYIGKKLNIVENVKWKMKIKLNWNASIKKELCK